MSENSEKAYFCQENPSEGISDGSVHTHQIKLHVVTREGHNVHTELLQGIDGIREMNWRS